MPIDNDTRGWIMTALSGVACVFGASFICVDIIVRQFPGKKNFRIQDSDVFLSLSLSLSFGVMLFSALYSMLPSSKRSLEAGGFSPKAASWIMIGCFIGGVVGIQLISRVMHHYVPHNVVECEHQHDDEESPKKSEGVHDHDHDHSHGHGDEGHAHSHTQMAERQSSLTNSQLKHLPRPQGTSRAASHRSYFGLEQDGSDSDRAINANRASSRPRTLQSRLTESLTSLATGKDANCHDDESACYGYSDTCPPACFRTISARASRASLRAPTHGANRPAATKSLTATEATPLLQDIIPENELLRPHTHTEGDHADLSGPSAASSITTTVADLADSHSHPHPHPHTHDAQDAEPPHHHHVPQNAFLSIGLQTSIAIALHKLPEGFITYATNHANPKLGVSVFLALFIHNITEGFAMALPLYLAINNRLKAMLVSFALGGLSQPLGAGVAAAWFKLAGKKGWEPDESVYGGMFAVTAGIMASVALQLFQESLGLAHSKGYCLVGAFAGMAILGISSALTA